jgi:GSCFA family
MAICVRTQRPIFIYVLYPITSPKLIILLFMTSFRTEFSTRLHKKGLSTSSSILTLGSCFADGIGNRLRSNKFNTLVNPFGATYNPFSIHQLLQLAIHRKAPSPETYLDHDGVHYNYNFHSSLGALNKAGLEEKLNKVIAFTHEFLKGCQFLFLTYGTSWVYERKDNGAVVANCHKKSSSLFTKKLLTSEMIIRSFQEMYSDLKTVAPDLQIVLTLSPVRHLKDTLELNSVSKSIVRIACHSIKEMYADVDYFPAYEIMMDDLRDYRFYASDMIHPSVDAEDYIWEKFAERYFPEETKSTLHEWQAVKKMMAHKPFYPESPSHQQFLKDIRSRLIALQSRLDVSEELRQYEIH